MKFNLQKLKTKRKELELKHRHCANAIGKSVSTYTRKELGEFPFTQDELAKIATLFKCDISDFFDIPNNKGIFPIIHKKI